MERKKETFIDIEGYDGLYQVGTQGTVVSLGRDKVGKGNSTYHTPERVLTESTNKFGYVSVSLTDDYGYHKKIDIHRLVALNHIPNPENKPQVNHIDGVKSNNNIDNLEWCTQAENSAHAAMMGLVPRGENHCRAIFTKEQVLMMKKLIGFGGLTNVQIAEVFGTTQSNVSRIKTGSRWAHL